MSKIISEQILMRIFIGEEDRYNGRPLYEALLELLREEGFSGATVLRAIAGFGEHHICHTQKLLDLSASLPVIIEVIDNMERFDALMPAIDQMMQGGTITFEQVRVVRYSQDG